MRRDAEKFRYSLKVVGEYKRPNVYHVRPDDYSSDARYIDTEYVHYMGNAPDCHMLALHYESEHAAAHRRQALSWSVHDNGYPIWVTVRSNCIYLIRKTSDE